MSGFHTRKWSPITDLPTDWETSLYNEEVTSYVKAWHEQAGELREQDLYKQFLAELRRQWAIETGIIEGVYTLSQGATKALIEQGLDASLISHDDTDDEPEAVVAKINDHHHAIMGLYQFVSEQRPLGTSYIRELHAVLTRHQTTYVARDTLGNVVTRELPRGEWKRIKNNVEHPDGTIFEYCPPEHVDHEMDNLIAMHKAHRANGVSPDIEAAWLHHRFSVIHPFVDGNGRVARCLATLILLRDEWLPLVVTRDDRAAYIDGLRGADAGDLKPLVDLIGHLQRRSIRNAWALRDQVVRASTEMSGILDSVKSKFEERRKAMADRRNKAFETTDSLHELTRQRLEEIAREIDKAIVSEGDDFKAYATSAARSDKAAGHNRFQIIECARHVNYFPNLAEYQAWCSLNIKTNVRVDMLFAFHGSGRQSSGVLACVAMIYTRERADTGDGFVSEVQPLCEEPFEFTYAEDRASVLKRFERWREDVILKGLDYWRSMV